MSWSNQGWKARRKKGGITVHVNTKKGVTVSSSVTTGGDSYYRTTVSASTALPPGYYRHVETINLGGMWKRKTTIKRTLEGVLWGLPKYDTKEYHARKRMVQKQKETGTLFTSDNKMTLVRLGLGVLFLMWMFN